jgi:mycoredoxin
MDKQGKIVMYSTPWCGDCVRSKKVFDQLGIPFTEVDIDYDKEGFEIAKKIQNQNPRITTIVFEDGSFLIEPSDVELTNKINSL